MLLIFIIILATDQLLKWWFFSQSLFTLNTGLGLGFLSELNQWVSISISLLFILLIYLLFRKDLDQYFARLSLTFIISGALSNILDRVIRGGVIDYIDLGVLPVFNIADFLIVLGILSLIKIEFFKDEKAS